MRLLNTATYQLTEFSPAKVPIYAILSHTWNEEEVTYSDIQNHEKASKLKGYQKLVDFCKEAARHGLQWGWMDTCCIDKTSSAELSEAINSMFQWYKQAFACYVYLENCSATESCCSVDLLRPSRWFRRGWTLQELLAPNNVVFYNERWHDIGTRESLGNHIARITGIDIKLLMGDACIGDYSIAQKMCWASFRNTTRIEDMAYSLMGIFEVNMPLLYGEGWKAFKRLQEEIIRSSTDQSIFAWCADFAMMARKPTVLALLPSDFRNSHRIVPIRRRIRRYRPAHSVSNSGLQIDLPLYRPSEKTFLGVLDCYSIDEPGTRVAIHFEWKDDAQWSDPLGSGSSMDINTNQRLFCQRADTHILKHIPLEEIEVKETVALTVSPLWEPPMLIASSLLWLPETEVSLVEQNMGLSGCSLVWKIPDDYRFERGSGEHQRTVSYLFSNGSDVHFCIGVEWWEKVKRQATKIKIKMADWVRLDETNDSTVCTTGREEDFSTDATFHIHSSQWVVRAKLRQGLKPTRDHMRQILFLTVVVEPTTLRGVSS